MENRKIKRNGSTTKKGSKNRKFLQDTRIQDIIDKSHKFYEEKRPRIEDQQVGYNGKFSKTAVGGGIVNLKHSQTSSIHAQLKKSIRADPETQRPKLIDLQDKNETTQGP